MVGFNEQLKENLLFIFDELKMFFWNCLNLLLEVNDDFFDCCLDGGDWYFFLEGCCFVLFYYVDEFCICVFCGLIEVYYVLENYKLDLEWYCFFFCCEIEILCQEIYECFYNSFIFDVMVNGLIFMKLLEIWSINEKMFVFGGQGYGFVVEWGNYIVDRVCLKNVWIFGDNNVRNGADRLVSGIEIQMKYCLIAVCSVGAVFDG